MKLRYLNHLIFGLFVFFTFLSNRESLAIDADQLPQIKKTVACLYVDAKEAYELKKNLGNKALFVDIRTRGEISYTGMPLDVDIHIPYMEHPYDAGWDEKNSRFQLEPNSAFAMEIAKRLTEYHLDKSDVLILMCRSGDRSAKAANLLNSIGYKYVYTVVDGFEGDLATSGSQIGQRVINGWKNAGLPWSYKLDKKKMFFLNN